MARVVVPKPGWGHKHLGGSFAWAFQVPWQAQQVGIRRRFWWAAQLGTVKHAAIRLCSNLTIWRVLPTTPKSQLVVQHLPAQVGLMLLVWKVSQKAVPINSHSNSNRNDQQNTQKGKILPRCHLCVETTNNVPRYTRPQEKKPAKPTEKCVFYQRKRIQNKNSSMRMKNTEHFHQFSQCSLLFFSLLHFIS